MPEELSRGMDKTKQPAEAGRTLISSNTGQPFESTSCCSNNISNGASNNKPESPSQTPLPTARSSGEPILYYVGKGTTAEYAETGYLIDSRTWHDDLPSPVFTSFSGVTLDHAQPGRLSEFHALEDTGKVRMSTALKMVATEVGGRELNSFPLGTVTTTC